MSAPQTARRTPPTWAVATVAGVFALLFAYAIWSAISYLVAWIQTAGATGMSLTPTAWVAWILAIALPIVAFAVALAVGRRRGLITLTLLLLGGLALVAAYWLDVVAYTAAVPPLA